MNTINSKMCISCPIAHSFVSEYANFYKLHKKHSAKKYSTKEDEKQLIQNLKDSILKLSKILNLNGKYNTLYNFFVNMSNDKKKTHLKNRKFNYCIKNIHPILLVLKIFFDKVSQQECLYLIQELGTDLLDEMRDFLISNNLISETTINNDKEKYTYYGAIVNKYCNHSIEKVKYTYCNPIQKYNPILKDIDINKLRNCSEQKYLNLVNSLPRYILNRRIYYAKKDIGFIMSTYLKKSPKNSGYIIDNLMKKQGITDTDIAILLFKDSNKKTQVENWHRLENKELPKQAKLHLQELAKIFLVSEDVLSCGTGKIYGNWKIALDENTSKKFKDELLTSDDIKELEKIEISQHKRPSVKTKEHIYDRIRTFINPNENDFEKMISENPEFFCEEDFCLFTHEEDGEEYYDYDLMYENLLHPEDFDTLLSVLEELQAIE